MKRIAKILLAVALVVCCLMGMMLCTQAATEMGIVASPETGTAYKFGFSNGSTTYYFTGAMQGYYGATTTDAASGVDVYLESADGGYYLYFMDGSTKTYIYIYEYMPTGSQYPKGSFGLSADKPEVCFTYNSTVNTLVATYGENSYFMGTWGTYTTISASSTYYIEGSNAANVDVTQYPARLYTADGSSGGSTTVPTTPPTTAPAAGNVSVVSAPKTGTAYKFGFNNGSVDYLFTGAMQGYYGATTTSAASAVDVYLESADGGYYLYFMDGSTKTYIYIYEYIPTGSQYPKGSFGLSADKPEVCFTYNSAVNTLVATYGENSYFMGTWGTYTTISASSTYYIEGDNAANVDVSQYPARLYAVEAEENPLEITAQPTTQKVKAGTTAKFTVKASGDGLKYQWQYRTSSSGSWTDVSAASGKTASYSMTAAVRHSGYEYRCKVTDSAGEYVYTNAADLYVLGIKTQPTTQKVKAGATAKFTVSATGASKTYQWQYRTSSSGSWKDVSAASGKTASYSMTAQTRHSSYQYRCKITDSADNVVYTNTVSLYVLGIKTQPTTQKVKAGATSKFTVAATGANKTYQWQYRTSSSSSWKNVSAASGKTASYSLTAATRHSGYQYRCKVTDSAGNYVYTKVVYLYVLGITSQPSAQTVKAGATAKFTVSATGANKVYQWQYKTASGSWTNVSAASGKTASYSLVAAARHNGYQYRCKITDSAGNVVYSNAVKLTVK